ncbi:MAG: aryl-sulfate sulfotransferase [Sarcina sp.]
MEKIFEMQNNILLKINNEYQAGNFTEKNPYINLNPFGKCPLTALVKFRTDKPCKISVNVCGDIKNEFEKIEYEHEIPILGLIAGIKNNVELICTYKDGSIEKNQIFIITQALPKEYPNIDLKICDNKKMGQGMTAISLGMSEGVKTTKHMYSIIDEKARVRWLYTGVACHIFDKIKNGNLIVDAPVSSGICGAYTSAGFIEMDFLGRIIEFYPIKNGLHHDVIEINNGNFLAITQRENTKQDLLVEIDRKSKKIIDTWDFRKILDFNRETVIDKISVNHPLDWLHLNSLVYDEKNNYIIASSRNQSTVIKFNKKTSEIKWILAPHYGWKDNFKKYLLKPIGNNFEWSYSQHTPIINSEGNILLFDNGNFRGYDIDTAILAHNNYSRGVEYKINENEMTISQIWEYGKARGNELYCAYLGAIRLLKNNNRLLCFGGTTKDIFGNPIDDMKSDRMKNEVTIIEVCGNEVVFEIKMKNKDITKPIGYKCYRAERFDLY